MVSRLAAATSGCFILCYLAISISASQERYVVYRAEPSNKMGLAALRALKRIDHEIEIDFWKEAHHLGDHADVMVPDKFVPFLESKLHKYGVAFNVTVPDVERLIMRNEHKMGGATFGSGDKRLNDDPMLDSPRVMSDLVGKLKGAKYPFGDYASYAEMIRYMRAIEFYYPSFTKIVRIGMTHEGRPIEGLKIGFPIAETNKPAVFIDGNIHAREWASSHTALFIINELVAGYGEDAEITRQINDANFFIVPCLNADGYEYTRSSPAPAVRLWRKNRSPERCTRSLWGGERCCSGVDLNRNFDFHWAETGASTEPCSNIYAGESAFSEPETRAVEDFFRSPEMRGKIGAYLTLHTYGQLFIHPFSHATNMYPKDIEKLRITAMKATDRLKTKYGTVYQVGTGANILSPASGGSDDWAKDQMKIKYVFLIELRPEEQLSNGFILHKRELIPTGIETFEAVKEVTNSMLSERANMRALNSVDRQKNRHRTRASTASSTTSTTPLPTTALTTTVASTTSTSTTRQTPRATTTTSTVSTSTTTKTTPTTTPSTTTPQPTTTTTLPSTTTQTTPQPTTATTQTSTTIQPVTTQTTPTSPATSIIPKHHLLVDHSTRLPLVPTRRRPWLTYKPKMLRRITTTPRPIRTLSTTALATTTSPVPRTKSTTRGSTSRSTTSTTSEPSTTSPRSTTTTSNWSTLWPTPASTFFEEWWSMKRHTKQPPAAPPVFSTVFTTHPELRSSVADIAYYRTHNRVSTLHIERIGGLKIPPPAASSPKSLDNIVPYAADCKDMRLSCEFWIQNAPRVCTEQSAFMQVQCALTCKFCTNVPPPMFVDQIDDFRTQRKQ